MTELLFRVRSWRSGRYRKHYRGYYVISDKTRYHEAGHAIGSLKLGIGLDDPGIVINSDEEACTHIRVPDGESLINLDYCICRAATKLSGPAAQLRFEKRPFTEQELEKDHRTFQDLKEAKMILQQYWTSRGERNDDKFQHQFADAGIIAHNVVEIHWSEVEAIGARSTHTADLEERTCRGLLFFGQVSLLYGVNLVRC